MADSPLLAGGEEAIVKRFEISQVQRAAPGLHKNQNCEYLLVKEDIRFQIKKVMVWFFRMGIGFLTIEACGESLDQNKVLDLNRHLCAVGLKYKISYKQARGKNEYKIKTFMIKELVQKFLELQKYIPLQPYPK